MLSKNDIKLIKSLKNKKQRHLNNMFVVEGKKSVSEFINSSFDLHKLFSININDFNMILQLKITRLIVTNNVIFVINFFTLQL